MPHQKIYFCLVATLCTLFLLSTVSWAQEDSEPIQQTTQLVAYNCEYDSLNLSFSVSLTVLDSNKRPIRDSTYSIPEGSNMVRGVNNYTLSVFNADHQPLEGRSFENRFSNRNPVRLLILPDVTSTVPVEGLKDPLRNFIARLSPEDELAVMPFGSSYNISDIEFGTNHDEVVEAQIESLSPQQGDNDLWGAVEDALLMFSPSYNRRQILIVLTDSRHSNMDEAIDLIDNDLLPMLAESDVQVFFIGFRTTDYPSLSEISRLAVGGNGAYWYIDESLTTVDQLEAALDNVLLTDVINAINADILLQVNTDEIPSQVQEEFVSLVLELRDAEGNVVATDEVNCPYDSQEYTITFENLDNGQVIASTMDVHITIDPAIPPDSTVIFRLDNSPIQPGEDSFTVRLSPTEIMPGSHSILAILFRNGSELKRTDQVHFEVHAPLTLTAEDSGDDGTIQVTARLSNDIRLELYDEVIFQVEDNRGELERIGSARFDDGVATFQWSSTTYVEQAGITEDEEVFIVAYVEGLEDYAFTPIAVSVTIRAIQPDLTIVALALIVLLSIPLGVLNWMVHRRIERASVDKLMRNAPDKLPRHYADTIIGKLTYNDDEVISLPINRPISHISRAGDDRHHNSWLIIPTERVPRDKKQGQATISRQGDATVIYSGGNWYFAKLLATQQKYVVGKRRINRVKAIRIQLGTPIYIEHIGTLVVVKSNDAQIMDTTAYG